MSLDHDTNQSVKKPAGAVLVDGKYVGDTRQCVHCSAHWVVEHGSGKKRGWCMNCKGFLCGSPNCMDRCIPLEARLQGWEGNKTKKQVLRDIDSMGRTIAL